MGKGISVALTPKQQRFVELYLVDLNATKAARDAGYSAKNADKIGSQLLGKTRVAQAIAECKAKRSIEAKIDAQWVLERLIENRNKADEAGEFSVVNRALEIIGRHTGGFAEKHEHDVTATAVIVEEIVDDRNSAPGDSQDDQAASGASELSPK